jgi:hypothetical protein
LASLTDMQGRTVLELAPMADRFTMDLSGLASGMYHLRTVSVSGVVDVQRVVRE